MNPAQHLVESPRRAYVGYVTPNGDAVKALREAHGLTQGRLAHRIGRSKPFLSRIERGERGASDATIRQIAAALKCPIAAITHRETPP